jgi:hypothetical protein
MSSKRGLTFLLPPRPPVLAGIYALMSKERAKSDHSLVSLPVCNPQISQ